MGTLTVNYNLYKPDYGEADYDDEVNASFDTIDDELKLNEDDRHSELHAVSSHNDTTATGAELETLTDGSDADLLHIHAIADAHITSTANPHSVDATDVSLGNVNNSSTTNGLLEISGGNARLKSATNIDLQGYKLIAGVCDNGATLPTTGLTKGYWFRHTPTGRDILYQYGTSSWIPFHSFDSMTVYVDNTDGTDALTHGTAVDSSAFKTIQFAIDAIPGSVGGNVLLNINGETYSEAVTINGKNFTGDYTITLQGTLSLVATATQDSSVQGATSTQGSITDTGAFTGQANKLLYSSNNDEYRLIDSVTANTGTIVDIWSAAPTGDYTIYDWGTEISDASPLIVNGGQQGVIIYDIKFIGSSNFCGESNFGASFTAFRCAFTGSGRLRAFTYASFTLWQTLITCNAASRNVRLITSSGVMHHCKVIGQTTSDDMIIVDDFSRLGFHRGSIIDGASLAGIEGIVASRGSQVVMSWLTGGYCRVRNCGSGASGGNGLTAQTLSGITTTVVNQYSGNDTDENAVAASFGYID